MCTKICNFSIVTTKLQEQQQALALSVQQVTMHTQLMTLFLQYNVNNHILDGARHLWWPSIVSESVLSKDLLNSEPLCVILATPLQWCHFNGNLMVSNNIIIAFQQAFLFSYYSCLYRGMHIKSVFCICNQCAFGF